VIRIDDDHFGAVVADVSDKGMPAALYMALARSLILAEGHRSLSPRQVLENVNRLLMELGEPGMFVTVFYAVVDCRTRMMTYTRAGHDRPVILRKGELIQLGGQGMALGVMTSDPFTLPEEEIRLQEGDRLLLFSDGLIDALGKDGARYTLPRLHNFWQKLPLIQVKDLCSLTFEVLAGYQEGTEQSDDMTLLAIGVA
jgi:sigma-B regulation protein RsbU (phosphoserine phosphatase)